MPQRPRALKVRNRNPMNTRAMTLLQSSVQFGAAPRAARFAIAQHFHPGAAAAPGTPGLPLATLFRAVGAKSKARCINARRTSKLNSLMFNEEYETTNAKDCVRSYYESEKGTLPILTDEEAVFRLVVKNGMAIE